MTRATSAALLAAQQGNYTPYINLVFHDRDDNNTEDLSLATDSTNRIMHIEHHELMYDDYAFIVLRNNDLAIPDLRGWWVEIGYGADTTGFGGSGNEYEKTARLWVTNQLKISAPGTVVTHLLLEGVWRRLARHLVITRGTAPFFDGIDAAFRFMNPYEIIEYLLEVDLQANGRSYMAATLDPIGDQTEFGMVGHQPYFEINSSYPEPSLEIIQRALGLSKCFLRARKTLNFEVRFPQDSDAVDATYYSDQVPYFHEWVESESVLVPNRWVFYGNAGDDGLWTNYIEQTTSLIGANEEVVTELKYFPDQSSPFILSRYVLAHQARVANRRVAGRMIIHHDARLEIHDRIEILDSRNL